MHAYMSIRHLPAALRPCIVARTLESVMVAVHPGTPRMRVLTWLAEHLSIQERDAIREAVGVPPVGGPVPDWVFDSPEQVPEALLTRAERAGVIDRHTA